MFLFDHFTPDTLVIYFSGNFIIKNIECIYYLYEKKVRGRTMKYSAHSTYHNREKVEVPSVTTILKILNKPFLSKWANIMGFQRRNIDEILEKSSRIGTMVHKLVEAYLLERYFIYIPCPYTPRELAMCYLDSFMRWRGTHEEVKPIFMERQLSSEKFGGTVDFYGMVDGKKTILDFKTSKRVYSSMFLQLAAYCIMVEEQGLEVEQLAIIIIHENKYKERFIQREELEPYITVFRSLVEVFHSWYDINEKDGWGSILV
jgi:CRISPR/Cas system-associated exonuclease Cas4 (RecB family)